MAIPASGSVSLSTIQSEWGGSNPISMSEYYSGSLATNSTSSSISSSRRWQCMPYPLVIVDVVFVIVTSVVVVIATD